MVTEKVAPSNSKKTVKKQDTDETLQSGVYGKRTFKSTTLTALKAIREKDRQYPLCPFPTPELEEAGEGVLIPRHISQPSSVLLGSQPSEASPIPGVVIPSPRPQPPTPRPKIILVSFSRAPSLSAGSVSYAVW